MDDLLSAILADPDADEPRAVYADQLLDAGDRRGELIQLQLQLGRPLGVKEIQADYPEPMTVRMEREAPASLARFYDPAIHRREPGVARGVLVQKL